MPANVIWAVMLVAVMFGFALWLPAAVLAGLLGLPVAGMHHMAAQVARGEGTSLSEFFAGMRRHAGPALALGFGTVLLAIVLLANVLLGLELGGVAGWIFSAFALYGVIGLLMFLVAAWPMVVDPLRAELPLRRRLWLAALVNLARPGRMFALTFVIGVLLVVSTALFAALLTVSIAFASLVGTRYVLPAADRLEGRPTVRSAE